MTESRILTFSEKCRISAKIRLLKTLVKPIWALETSKRDQRDLKTTYSRVSNSRGCTHLFFRGFSLTHDLIGYLHDFQNSSLPRKIFAFGSIWKTFLTKNVNYGHFIHLHDFSNEKRQKKNKMFIHNTFYEFREFGCFRKIPRSTLIRYLHDLRFFMIFPHSRLLDLHGY